MRDVDLDVQALVLRTGVRRQPGMSSGTIGSGSGPTSIATGDSGRTRPAIAWPAGRRRPARAGSIPSQACAAEQDLEGDELVPRRLERDPCARAAFQR